jgi:putative membrane protein
MERAMWWHDGLSGWDWLWMTMMMGVVWIPIVLVVLWAIWSLSRPGATGGTGDADRRDDPLEVAQRTYARGEISRERYLEIVEDLKAAGAPGRDRGGGAA